MDPGRPKISPKKVKMRKFMFEESARPLLEFKKTNFVINLGLDPDWESETESRQRQARVSTRN
jgi:hypothetical protein